MPLRGIFATWQGVNFIEKPDTVFKKQLEVNAVYPFEETEINVYVMTVRSARFAMAMGMCFFVVMVTALFYNQMGSVDEMIVFPIVIALGYFRFAMKHLKDRTYILNNNIKMYEFYRGKELICRDHYHNVYIRLKGLSSGGGDIYYSVIIGGFEVDVYEITGSMTESKKLAKSGRRLAHRLDLNYFDSQDKSCDHVIRHRCPYVIVR